jgi:low affinity Fe/Cu permease
MAMSSRRSNKASAHRTGENSTQTIALQERFGRFAHEASRIAGHPLAFLTALSVVILWGATGPLYAFTDTCPFVINTGTTIVTFLMVFLIQNPQNRDTLAIQLKLAEIIFQMKEAEDRFATIEVYRIKSSIKCTRNSARAPIRSWSRSIAGVPGRAKARTDRFRCEGRLYQAH